MAESGQNFNRNQDQVMAHKKLPITMLLIGIMMAAVTTGCEDQLLNKAPLGEQTEATFFQTEEHAIQATNATYQMLREFHIHSHLWLGITDIASDDADKGSTPPDGPMQQAMDSWTFDASTPNFVETWRAYYRGIYRANLAITNIPDIEEMDDGLRERLVAENKFLRAYFYFFLVRSFGGVPLLTQPLEPDEFQQERASAEEIYDLIEQDLLDAAGVLPLKSGYPSSELGRITQGAAQAMLAKVYLFQQRYEEAEQMAREVIDSGEYSLYPDYKRIFWPEGENSSESVFEVQAVALETGGGGTPYSQPQGVRGQPNLGWGFNNPSDDLLATYEPGDPRLGATLWPRQP
jgi:starch-binding outer membrane protein, SusD/RagB family